MQFEGSFRIGIISHDCKVITVIAETSAYHAVRLQFVNQFIKLLALLGVLEPISNQSSEMGP